MAFIEIYQQGNFRKFELRDYNTLGRQPNNTIQVLDSLVSKVHCQIEKKGNDFVLKDNGSMNGTTLGESRVSEHTLKNKDEFFLGSTKIVFFAEERPSKTMSVSMKEPDRKSLVPGFVMGQDEVESFIQKKLTPQQNKSFIPESSIEDERVLRQDYEKLRVSYEVIRAIGSELEIDNLLNKILDCAFDLLPADRGVILLFDQNKELKPMCIRSKKEGEEQGDLLISNTIINTVLNDKTAVISNDASVDSRFKAAKSIIMQGIRSSMAVPLIYSDEVFGILLLDSHIATAAFSEKDLQLLQNMANQAAIAIQNSLYAEKLEQEAVTRERFQRLLSPAIAEQVMSGQVEIAKGGELRETTILFTDIRGFTNMSEKRDAQDIVDMLNEYFELMVEIIFKHQGTLDKFVGDEIMALYGAPVAHDDDPVRAVRSALEMKKVLAEFNQVRVADGENEIQIGIGINTGNVIAGYLGSSKALEYTVIGDPVNTGSRLCSIANPGQILISEMTYQKVKDFFEVKSLGGLEVKGKTKSVQTYEVLDFK